MPKLIAIIGAGGFVGTRLVEYFVRAGEGHVRAIVRNQQKLTQLSKLDGCFSSCLADAEEYSSLRSALDGVSVVVNLIAGAPATIVRSARIIHEASVAADVSRLIHLSSAVVYGDIESPSFADDSPPLTRHWMPYARAKATAESELRNQIGKHSLQIAVLRPGIVWGPRSPHTVQVIESLARKDAYLVDGGKGVFNSIYIDNLTSCIHACCAHSADVTGFFNVADDETLTWYDFYSSLAKQLDYDIARVHNVSGARMPITVRNVVEYLQALPIANGIYHHLKARYNRVLIEPSNELVVTHAPVPVASGYVAKPKVDREIWHLQKTKYKLPADKFARHFDWVAPVSFEEGVRQTTNWMTKLGYGEQRASQNA